MGRLRNSVPNKYWVSTRCQGRQAPSRPYQPDVYPAMWGGHPLSYANPVLSKAFFQKLFESLDANNLGLAGVEPVNTAGFFVTLDIKSSLLLRSRTIRRNLSSPLFRSQSRLPQVIGQMIGTTQQDGETVTQRFFCKVVLRHGTVLFQPVRR